jgi:hypothetical protein
MYLARREWLEPGCCNWLDLAPICFEVFLSREPIRKHALLIAPFADARFCKFTILSEDHPVLTENSIRGGVSGESR